MKLSFRVECPHCFWGYGPSPNDINQGYIKAKCKHCGKDFFFKITVNDVKIEVTKDYPEAPCTSRDFAEIDKIASFLADAER